MKRLLRQLARRVLALRAVPFLLAALAVSSALAQGEPVHYFHRANLPPGAVGRSQLLRGGPLAGYYQPVEVRVPEGASVSFADCGQFPPSPAGSALAGLLIGEVYRLKVTGIPRQPGAEIFPTIEVIDRLYPPPGCELHFPIPVQLTAEELNQALEGNYVTRVIYLEDPRTALPVQDDAQRQRYFEVRADEDPLQVADRLGRPMAILRMGSRVPLYDAESQRFSFESPPLVRFERPAPLPDAHSGLEPPGNGLGYASNGPIPRVPLMPRAVYTAVPAAAWQVTEVAPAPAQARDPRSSPEVLR